jgi:hypothetical protein
MLHYRFVVARYNEDVTWCRRYPHTVYNKGGHLDNSTPLPNIGREAHTYLYHIVTQYDNLDEFTIFVQGNPFDHCRNVLERVEGLTRDGCPDFELLAHDVLLTTSEHCKWHRELPMKAFHTRLFGPTPPRTFRFGAGAQFVVSKRLIRTISKSTYQSLLNTIDKDQGPWVIERFWEQLFLAADGVEGVPPLRLLG